MKPGSTVHILVKSVRKAVSALGQSAFDSNCVTTRSGSSCGESTRLPSSLREILNDQTREAYVDYLVKDEVYVRLHIYDFSSCSHLVAPNNNSTNLICSRRGFCWNQTSESCRLSMSVHPFEIPM